MDIKEFCQQWKNELRDKASMLAKPKHLGIVGHNSMPYVKGIVKDCAQIGIHIKVYDYEEDINFADYMKIVYCAERYNDYIILQTPLPPAVDIEELKKCIDPQKDIDNISGKSNHLHNTPLGIIKYLDACNFDYCGADAVIIGRSDVVGKPMAQMLLDKNCTVTICHSKTKHLDVYTQWADLVVVAVGKPEWFDPELAVCAKAIIDVGINLVPSDEGTKIVGDVDRSGREGLVNKVTPVPGGVGLLTRCALLEQIVNN